MKKKIELYLLVDHSGSTTAFIDKINISVKKMIEKLKEEHKFGELSGFDVDFVFIPFNHNFKIFGPTPLDNVEIADLEADGATDIGSPIIKAIEMANDNYSKLKNEAKVKALHPIIFLFTDGVPDAGVGCTPKEQEEYDSLFEKAAIKIKEGENNKKLSFVACSFQRQGIDSQTYKKNTARIERLTMIKDRVIKLSEYQGSNNPIAEFFEKNLVDLFILGTTTRQLLDGVDKFK